MKKSLSIPLSIVTVFSFLTPLRATLAWQELPISDQAILRGCVTDALTGEPIDKVKIIVIGADRSTVTDPKGEFVLSGLHSGEIELYITTIGYGLVKKRVTLPAGGKRELQIALHPEAAQRLDEVTVTIGPFEQTETNAASEYSLTKQELQSVSMVLIADPIRALQALPGVVGNDDFRSEFALRGAGFRRVGLFVDGIFLPDNPAHTVYGHERTGQISILNADTMAFATLLSGAYPSKYGDSTAGMLDLETRDGNRVRPSGRIAVGMLSSSATFDGPLPRKRGAWLVSARKSYLQYLVNALTDDEEKFDGIAVDFTDAQAKAAYHVTPRHQFGINALLGRTDLDPNTSKFEFDPHEIARSRSRTSTTYASWNYNAGQSFTAQTKFFSVSTDYMNANLDRRVLQEGEIIHRGLRSDINSAVLSGHRLQAGIYLRAMHGNGKEVIYYSPPPTYQTLADYNRRGNQQGYYLQETWSSRRFPLALTAGARIEHSGLNRETVVTPRAALSLAPFENTKIRLGWGQYREFPEFMHLLGSRGTLNLRAERATHYNFSVERAIGANIRFLVEAYHREDKDLLFSMRDSLLRNGETVFLEFPFQNSLRGYARGFEVSFHRRSANRLTGWLAYAYSTTRMRERITGLSFPSDYDQRHTISAHGSYRLTNTLNLSSQWRYGSGMPMVGSSNEIDGQFSVYSERNGVRLPAYSRVDLRVNKAFHFKRSKLTISGEIINLFGRDNLRQNGMRRDKLLPLLPSIAASFEF